MRHPIKLLVYQLDKKLQPFKGLEKQVLPEKGWINAIRTSLNMTLDQLGIKLNTSKQSIKQLEDREKTGAISMKTMKEVANSLDMHFVYGFVPKQGSIEKLVDLRAERLARKIVMRTNQTMKLENQGTNDAQINRAILELAKELKREMHKSLWD